MFRKLFEKFFDYKIVGAYYDTDKQGHSVLKYHKKYFLRKRGK